MQGIGAKLESVSESECNKITFCIVKPKAIASGAVTFQNVFQCVIAFHQMSLIKNKMPIMLCCETQLKSVPVADVVQERNLQMPLQDEVGTCKKTILKWTGHFLPQAVPAPCDPSGMGHKLDEKRSGACVVVMGERSCPTCPDLFLSQFDSWKGKV